MPDAAGCERINTVEDVFLDLQGRRAGLIKALTTELENLSLYGHSNGTWEVYVPTDGMPSEIPEPVLGINFARDGMSDREWRILVAVHSDIWLLSVAFYHGGRLGFSKAQRKRLFTMINDLPTILEAVSGQAKKERKAKPKSNPKREPYRKKQNTPPPKPKYEDDDESWEEEGAVEDDEDDDTLCRVEPHRKQPKTPPPMPKYEDDDEGLEEEGGVEDDEDDDTLCGVCEHKYSSDEFWIFCDFCEKWFHGRCVKITPAQADYIDKFKCPLCCSSKRARP